MITDSDDDDADDEVCDSNNINWICYSAFLYVFIEWPSVSINHHSLEKKVQSATAQSLVASYMQVAVYIIFKAYYHCAVTSLQSSYDICL